MTTNNSDVYVDKVTEKDIEFIIDSIKKYPTLFLRNIGEEDQYLEDTMCVFKDSIVDELHVSNEEVSSIFNTTRAMHKCIKLMPALILEIFNLQKEIEELKR